MIIRYLKPEEKFKCSALMGTAFNFSIDTEYEKTQLMTENSLGAFDDDNETLMAQVVVKDYNCYTYNNILPTVGIAGVSTYPQYRRNGCIRELMKKIFSDANEKGWIMSYLYPFSFDYYRQFGYERAFQFKTVRFPISALSKYPRYQDSVLYSNKELLHDLTIAYEKFANKRNGMLTRDDYREWSCDPFKTLKYTYIFYNDQKEPDGYITFKINGNCIEILEFAYECKKTLLNILGFLRMFEGQHKEISITNIEVHSELDFLIGELRNVSFGINDGPMVRIINVKKYFETIIKPKENFSINIKVNDKFIENNNNCFKIVSSDGILTVEKTIEDYDVECDIPTLSCVATGSKSINILNYTYREHLTIKSKKELFFSLFTEAILNQFDRF